MTSLNDNTSSLVAGSDTENGVGICIKDSQKLVKFQNDACILKCGLLAGKVCTKGCMEKFEQTLAGTVKQDGIYNFLDINVDGVIVDSCVVKAGETLTTLFHQRSSDLRDRIREYTMYGLSKREVEILRLVLERKTRKEITNYLCISLSTLKTHMNNIYKKLPADLSKELQERKY